MPSAWQTGHEVSKKARRENNWQMPSVPVWHIIKSFGDSSMQIYPVEKLFEIIIEKPIDNWSNEEKIFIDLYKK